MQLFYTTHQEGDFLILEGEEAHHCANVLRHQAGHQINVTNGKGSLFHCTIIDKTKTTVRLMPDSEQKFDTPAHLNLSIAIAPTKNIDRFEWFVEKATEIGIGRIIPLHTKRSERTIIKHERLFKLMISAMKQSNHFYLPELHTLTTFKDLISEIKTDISLIAHCMADELPHVSKFIKPDRDVLICIGPEGDFTADEVHTSENAGFTGVSLGKSRLRTETAGIYACISFHQALIM